MTGSPAGPFVSHDRAFADVLGEAPRLELVATVDAHEGPVYAPDEDALYVTTLPTPTDVPSPATRRVAIKRLALDAERFPLDAERITVVRDPANVANGMALDHDGGLLVCEQGSRTEPARISRLDRRTLELKTVVEAWAGSPLNSPNDVVVKRDGTVWFTDPSYGALQGFRPAPRLGDYVYRFDPASGRLSVVADGLDKPNGLAFSPDEAILYVADSGAIQEPGSFYPARPHHVLAFDVQEGRHLANGRVFAAIAPGFPDGLKVDVDGRVYVSAASGVQVFTPTGDLIGEIRLPGAVNFTFGDIAGNLLFITADTAVWAATLQTTGAPTPTSVPGPVAATR